MGRSPCCEKEGLKKGPWTPEEDQKLLLYIEENGHGSWRALPAKAGLQRCGKSCRLRWTNYLRPDIKRGKFSLQEEQTIIQLHALLGNRWSAIATHLPKRTDNEIKNYWNTHLKKRLAKMGIDPVTHKPKTDALGPCQLKDAPNLSHMAQWEGVRLEAEARLVRECKLQVTNPFQTQLGLAQLLNKTSALPLLPPPPPPRLQSLCLDVPTTWQGTWLKTPKDHPISGGIFAAAATSSLESPTSTLNFSGNSFPVGSFPTDALPALEYVTNSGACETMAMKFPELKEKMNHAMHFHHGMAYSTDGLYIGDSFKTASNSSIIILPNFMEGLTDLLEENNDALNPSNTSGNSSDNLGGSCCGDLEDNKNYWNSILNLVNCSPTGSSPV